MSLIQKLDDAKRRLKENQQVLDTLLADDTGTFDADDLKSIVLVGADLRTLADALQGAADAESRELVQRWNQPPAEDE